jgi:molecular chaperone GrpE
MTKEKSTVDTNQEPVSQGETMNGSGTPDGASTPDAAAPSADSSQPAPEEPDDSPEGQIASLSRTLEKREVEIKELTNRHLRALADYDNLRRRTSQEITTARLNGSVELVKRLLPVIDTFESALRQFSSSNLDKKIMDGFEMLFMQISDILEKEGLKAIKAKGEKFDPNLHEALMRGNNPDLDDEIVLEEFEKGYLFKEKVLRPAKVQINQK